MSGSLRYITGYGYLTTELVGCLRLSSIGLVSIVKTRTVAAWWALNTGETITLDSQRSKTLRLFFMTAFVPNVSAQTSGNKGKCAAKKPVK